MFVILLFGKFVALFLMVVHHIEFYYVLVTALCLDVTAISTGSASISFEYVASLFVRCFFMFRVTRQRVLVIVKRHAFKVTCAATS